MIREEVEEVGLEVMVEFLTMVVEPVDGGDGSCSRHHRRCSSRSSYDVSSVG